MDKVAALQKMVQTMTLLLIMGLCFLLSGCGIPEIPGLAGMSGRIEKSLTQRTLDGKSDAMFEEIIEALENEDRETIKGFFSEYSIEHAEDIDSQIDELIAFYQGEMTEYDSQGHDTSEGVGFNGSEDIISEVRGRYTFKTTENEYLFELDLCPSCMVPEKEGLYNINIIEKSYYEQDENYRKFGTGRPGAFITKEE